MPELPEVETIVRELKSEIIGKKFWKVEAHFENSILPSAKVLVRDLPGLHILDVRRKGKYIIFVLDKKMRLGVHLRMTGRLLWKKVKGREQFLRASFTFSDATSLLFADVRKFGRIYFYPEKDFDKATGIAKVGLDPFVDDFTFQNFYTLFKNKKGILKNNLLRQDLITGIGNIYADEICYRIRKHPSSRLETLNIKDFKAMHEAILYCLEQGIQHCGVSVSDFVGTRGKQGEHQKYLQVYGRKGGKCYRCNSLIKKTKVAGRGTFYCEKCQQF